MTTANPPRPAALLTPADIDRIRADFPILSRKFGGKPLVYLDSAATAQKPRQVIEAIDRFYRQTNANVHRGVHRLSQEATHAFEMAREKVRRFIGAADTREVIFTRGATEAVNLVAQAYGRPRLKAGDQVLITRMEHHSNIVPWQMLCEQTGAQLLVAPMNDRGELMVDRLQEMLTPRVKIVSLVHISNALGTVNPVKHVAELAHRVGAVVLVDGAQAAPHAAVDVCDLGVDFYAASGHKVFGPTGIGVLYGRRELLEAMPPWMGGGDMILSVTFEKTTYNELPFKFEAGTPNIAGAIGLGEALDYISGIGMDRIGAYENELLAYATEKVAAMPEVKLIGAAAHKASILSFTIDGVHPHDLGTLLNYDGIAIRTGHHCAQPVMDQFGIPATARASLAFYNTFAEIDALTAALRRAVEMFR